MHINIKDNLEKMFLTVMETSVLLKEAATRELLKEENIMAKDFLILKILINTKEILKMEDTMDRVNFIGLMGSRVYASLKVE